MQKSESRYITLDAMRGFAVMGILAMNIIGFAMPEWAYITPAAYGGETVADRMAWLFSFVFIDGKMRGLFSLLFGTSLILITDRASSNGESAAQVHYRRMAWLAVFGLVHNFFIWYGDILFLYAMAGMVAFLFRDWAPARLVKWALIIFGLGLVFWGLQFGGLQILQYLATQPDASADLVRQYNDVKSNPDFSFDVPAQVDLHRGPYLQIVADKLTAWPALFGTVFMSMAETLPLMMIGMAMNKSGFILGRWSPADYRRWAWRLVPAGLIATGLLALWMIVNRFDAITALAIFFFWGAIPRLMLTIGYAAVLILLIARFGGSSVLSRVAAAGRAAFTNYLGTSIIMTTLFYGYGFGMFGEVGRLGLWAYVLMMWAVMLAWSQPWLKQHRYGPLEWLWRSLARGQMQPMRR
jgi:uncharacterized protein